MMVANSRRWDKWPPIFIHFIEFKKTSCCARVPLTSKPESALSISALGIDVRRALVGKSRFAATRTCLLRWIKYPFASDLAKLVPIGENQLFKQIGPIDEVRNVHLLTAVA
jgi:hypothetical protein